MRLKCVRKSFEKNITYLEDSQKPFKQVSICHTFDLPSINIKVDAIPNQLNHFIIKFNKTGLIFGQLKKNNEFCTSRKKLTLTSLGLEESHEES